MGDMRKEFINSNANQEFKVKSVEGGKITFVGGDIELVCGLPRKIEAVKDGMKIYVSKDTYTIRNIDEKKIDSNNDNKQHAVHADGVRRDIDATTVRDEQND